MGQRLAQGRPAPRHTPPRGTAHARPVRAPDLAGLLFDGLHRALDRAQQGLDLVGRLLQEEARHKPVHVAAALVHLWGEGGAQRERGWRGV